MMCLCVRDVKAWARERKRKREKECENNVQCRINNVCILRATVWQKMELHGVIPLKKVRDSIISISLLLQYVACLIQQLVNY